MNWFDTKLIKLFFILPKNYSLVYAAISDWLTSDFWILSTKNNVLWTTNMMSRNKVTTENRINYKENMQHHPQINWDKSRIIMLIWLQKNLFVIYLWEGNYPSVTGNFYNSVAVSSDYHLFSTTNWWGFPWWIKQGKVICSWLKH